MTYHEGGQPFKKYNCSGSAPVNKRSHGSYNKNVYTYKSMLATVLLHFLDKLQSVKDDKINAPTVV